MNLLFTYRVNRISAYFALWSFVLNTLVSLLYMATEAKVFVGLGFFFMVFYAVFMPVTLTIVTVNALVNYKDLKQHVMAIFMLLVSIAISISYVILLKNF